MWSQIGPKASPPSVSAPLLILGGNDYIRRNPRLVHLRVVEGELPARQPRLRRAVHQRDRHLQLRIRGRVIPVHQGYTPRQNRRATYLLRVHHRIHRGGSSAHRRRRGRGSSQHHSRRDMAHLSPRAPGRQPAQSEPQGRPQGDVRTATQWAVTNTSAGAEYFSAHPLHATSVGPTALSTRVQ